MQPPRLLKSFVLASCLAALCHVQNSAAIGPFPFASVESAVKPHLVGTNFTATGLNRASYLKTISGIVDYFHHFQRADGRIIDPFLHREVQYATPCYAWAATALVVGEGRSNLLQSAALSLDSALQQLADAKACDGHGNFFTVPCMFAYENLRDRVSRERRRKWEACLRRMDPYRCYRDLPVPNRSRLGNWNLVAAAGEFLRHLDGFTGMDFVETSLKMQRPFFTDAGMYMDPNVPMAYDHFPRHYMAIMLARGYNGQDKDLAELMKRAAWTSLLMQSPRGELPTGGRSAQHQWNEAQQCVTYEIFARRAQHEGDEISARAFKRAAHLALESVNRWIRPSGELNTVKNYFDPGWRHGFEGYSFHSQYNLLAASMLAIAWSFADDSIPEGKCPAEVGGFVIHLPRFHKVIANAGGLYAEIDTGADPHYNSTGLIRVHKIGVDSLVGPSDSAPANAMPLAVGIAWRKGDRWQPLAAFTRGRAKRVSVDVQEQRPDRVRFTITYELDQESVRAVRMDYDLTPERIRVTARVEGDTPQVQVRFPALVFDGRAAATVTVEGAKATVRLRNSREVFTVDTPLAEGLRLSQRPVSSRNGFLEAIEGVCNGRRVVYTLTPSAVPRH